MADKGRMTVQFLDYDSEVSSFQVGVAALTSANFTTQETAMDALRDAAAAITLGNTSQTVYANVDKLSITPASDQTAQRELKWLVSYHDTTSLNRFSCELPTADPDQLDPNDRAHAEIGDGGLVDAFVAAFEAVVKSPDGGAVVVDEITLVGRRV